ncbi:MAG: hypothetical protein ACI9EF_002109 [Pseudohongiellaceae bacterium]
MRGGPTGSRALSKGLSVGGLSTALIVGLLFWAQWGAVSPVPGEVDGGATALPDAALEIPHLGHAEGGLRSRFSQKAAAELSREPLSVAAAPIVSLTRPALRLGSDWRSVSGVVERADGSPVSGCDVSFGFVHAGLSTVSSESGAFELAHPNPLANLDGAFLVFREAGSIPQGARLSSLSTTTVVTLENGALLRVHLEGMAPSEDVELVCQDYIMFGEEPLVVGVSGLPQWDIRVPARAMGGTLYARSRSGISEMVLLEKVVPAGEVTLTLLPYPKLELRISGLESRRELGLQPSLVFSDGDYVGDEVGLGAHVYSHVGEMTIPLDKAVVRLPVMTTPAMAERTSPYPGFEYVLEYEDLVTSEVINWSYVPAKETVIEAHLGLLKDDNPSAWPCRVKLIDSAGLPLDSERRTSLGMSGRYTVVTSAGVEHPIELDGDGSALLLLAPETSLEFTLRGAHGPLANGSLVPFESTDVVLSLAARAQKMGRALFMQTAASSMAPDLRVHLLPSSTEDLASAGLVAELSQEMPLVAGTYEYVTEAADLIPERGKFTVTPGETTFVPLALKTAGALAGHIPYAQNPQGSGDVVIAPLMLGTPALPPTVIKESFRARTTYLIRGFVPGEYGVRYLTRSDGYAGSTGLVQVSEGQVNTVSGMGPTSPAARVSVQGSAAAAGWQCVIADQDGFVWDIGDSSFVTRLVVGSYVLSAWPGPEGAAVRWPFEVTEQTTELLWHP